LAYYLEQEFKRLRVVVVRVETKEILEVLEEGEEEIIT